MRAEEGYIGYIGLIGQTEVNMLGKAKVTILVITMVVALIVIVWAIVASVTELSVVWQ